MRFQKLTQTAVATVLAGAMLLPLLGRADDAKTPAGKKSVAGKATAKKKAAAKKTVTLEDIRKQQNEIANRYKRFEKALEAIVEVLKANEKTRGKALLVEQAIKQSKNDGISRRMEAIVRLLSSKEFGDATDDQEEVVVQLKSLLDLLLSEDTLNNIAAEKKRIEDLLKDLNKLITKQKIAQFKVERGKEDPAVLAAIQREIAKKTKELRDKIDRQDALRNAKPTSQKSKDGKPKDGKPKDGKPGDGKPKDGKPKDGKPGDGKPKDGKPKDGKPKDGKPKDGKPKDGKPKDGKPGDGKPKDGKPKDGKPGDGKPKDGKPKDGKPGDGKPKDGKPKDGMPSDGKPSKSKPGDNKPPENKPNDDQKTPGRDDIEKARKAMERAIKALEKADKEGASAEQDDARKALEDAKQKLEEILKQLREEERKILLQGLIRRFGRMLEMQIRVYRHTSSLGATDRNGWTAADIRKSQELSLEENKIVLEADQALVILRAEGSSVAFPEAVQDVREDMITVRRLLAEEKAGKDTQYLEREIMEALGEMIEALKKELEKKKDDKDKKPKPPKDGKPKDPNLVEKLAELKMLRSLQNRINKRTRRLGNRIKGDQATEKDTGTVRQLKNLAKRQARIQKATYDLATNKNQ